MTADAEQTVLLRKIEKNTREQAELYRMLALKAKTLKPQHTCPNCGYCPHCGRGGYRPYPYQPWTNPYPWYQPICVGDVPPFYTVTCTSTGTTGDASTVGYVCN